MSANLAGAHLMDELNLGFDAIVDEPASLSCMTPQAQLADEDAPETDANTDAGTFGQASGRQLRHRFVTPESIAELASTEKPSLLQRLFRFR